MHNYNYPKVGNLTQTNDTVAYLYNYAKIITEIKSTIFFIYLMYFNSRNMFVKRKKYEKRLYICQIFAWDDAGLVCVKLATLG